MPAICPACVLSCFELGLEELWGTADAVDAGAIVEGIPGIPSGESWRRGEWKNEE